MLRAGREANHADHDHADHLQPKAEPLRGGHRHVRSAYVGGEVAFVELDVGGNLAECANGSKASERLVEVGVERRQRHARQSLELARRPSIVVLKWRER